MVRSRRKFLVSALALFCAGQAHAQTKTPPQLSAATTVAPQDLFLVWPHASNGPLEQMQYSVLESSLQSALGATYLQGANNLSDLGSISIARSNLGLGGAAVLNVGQSTGTVAAGDDNRIIGACQTTGCMLTNAGSIYGSDISTAENDFGWYSGGSRRLYFYANPSGSGLVDAVNGGVFFYNYNTGGGMFFNNRPSFNGATPWDSANLNPASFQPAGSYQAALGYTPVNSAGDTMSGALNYSFYQRQGPNGSGDYDSGQMAEWLNTSIGGSEKRTITLGTAPGGDGFVRSANQCIQLVAGGVETARMCGGYAGQVSIIYGSVVLSTYAVFGLPACVDGARATVIDSTVAAPSNFGAAVAGGGTNHVPVWCDGGTSTWRIG